MKISEAFDNYRIGFIEMKNQSVRTVEMHELCKNNLMRYFGDIKISELSVAHISSWRNSLSKKISQNSVRGYILKLRVVLKYCQLNGIEVLNLGLVPVPKREYTTPSFLTPGEISKIINSTNLIRTKFIVSLLYSSGIRVSEMNSLNRGQIKNKSFTIIGKGGKPRLCFIDARTEIFMQKYLAGRQDNNKALIVSNISHKRLNRSDVELIIKNASIKAGIAQRVTPHTFRHSFATDFLKNNGNMRYLSELMGHASMDTTAMYAHVVNNDLESQYKKYHKY